MRWGLGRVQALDILIKWPYLIDITVSGHAFGIRPGPGTASSMGDQYTTLTTPSSYETADTIANSASDLFDPMDIEAERGGDFNLHYSLR